MEKDNIQIFDTPTGIVYIDLDKILAVFTGGNPCVYIGGQVIYPSNKTAERIAKVWEEWNERKTKNMLDKLSEPITINLPWGIKGRKDG